MWLDNNCISYLNFVFYRRACPECRTKSDFVTPSKYWMDDKDDKLRLIDGYKDALR